MRTIIFLLIIGVIGLQYKLWLGDGSVSQWRLLEKKIASAHAENKALSAHNRGMQADILELKRGEQALEEQARYELGMIKDSEVYYQFLE